jgi:hypothetical protein
VVRARRNFSLCYNFGWNFRGELHRPAIRRRIAWSTSSPGILPPELRSRNGEALEAAKTDIHASGPGSLAAERLMRVPKIQLATNDADRYAVCRFGSRIYVNEMKRTQEYADHQQEIIEGPLGKTGYVLMAEDSGHRIAPRSGCISH